MSNWPAYKVARAIGRSELRHLVQIRSVQPRYSLLFRSFERDLLPLCAEEGVAVIPYNPLAGGLLTGKHNNTAPPPEGSRFQLGTAGARYQDRYWHEQQFETIEAAAPGRQGRGDEHGDDGDALGALQPGDHRPHHRRQPAGATGRHPGRRGARGRSPRAI